MNKQTREQQDRIATRLMVHLSCAFLFALTLLYLSRLFTANGPINGINVLNKYASIMFYIGLALLVLGIIYVLIGRSKKVVFSEKVLTPAIVIGWPLAYMFIMASLGFTLWNYKAIFSATYTILGLFCIFYIIYYVFPNDFLYAGIFAALSVFSMYIIENLPTIINSTIISLIGSIAWYTSTWKAVLSIISALVGAAILWYNIKLKQQKGVDKKTGRRIHSKTSLYWPIIGVSIIHIVGNLAYVFAGVYYIYAMYAMFAFALVFSVTYFARLIYTK